MLKHLILILAFVAVAPVALAQNLSLSEAKAQGLVGEMPNGLVGAVVDDPSPQVRQLVARINEQRMAEYRQIAQETNAPLEAVQARAAKQIISRLPQGQYFKDAAGRWREK